MSLQQVPGPYQQRVKYLCKGNPNLEYLDNFMSESHLHHCKVAVIDFDVQINNHINSPVRIFDSSSHTSFDRFLDEFRQTPPHRRLFIVEDLVPEVIEALGYRFNIDPAFVASHISVSENSGDGRKDRMNAPRLPSLCDPYEQFHLKYWEVFTLDEKTWKGYTDKKAQEFKIKDYQLQNADTRRLDFNVWRNMWLEPSNEPKNKDGKTTKDVYVGLSRCKASFWSRKDDTDERSWDG